MQPRSILPGGVILGLLLSGLITGLLTLAGAALLERGSSVGSELALRCTAFQVGSPYAANTHIRLQNIGPETIGVRFDFVDDSGLNAWAASSSRSLAPWASDEVVFRTPALGTAVKLIYSSVSLRLSTEVLRDDEAAPEIRPAILCRAT